ncbi:MAG: GNAT family N-acetyltransferase [Clostridia bacterium]|nr:GNAT family N-acetyltransferase [Clostridia bacterium]
MIRKANIYDIDNLENLEKNSFEESVRFSSSSIKNSLNSKSQDVFIVYDDNTDFIGAATIVRHKYTLKIYSIAILKNYRGKGHGDELMKYIIDYSNYTRFSKIALEVNAMHTQLIKWYESFGFVIKNSIKDYYGEGIDGLKMELKLSNSFSDHTCKNIIVADYNINMTEYSDLYKFIRAKEYIEDELYHNLNCKVINMCRSYKYQSTGYYVSLLAAARDQIVIPDVTTIRDFADKAIYKSLSIEIDELIQKTFKKETDKTIKIKIYFGKTPVEPYKRIAKEIFSLYKCPLIEVEFEKNTKWYLKKLEPFAIKKSGGEDLDYLNKYVAEYFNHKRYVKRKLSNYKYDLAILVNPEEKTPPSNRKALKHFKEAAEKVGFYTEFIEKKDFKRINEFDALFIRETTRVNNHTYQFSRYAYSEGLYVIDDPWSILRCSNKLFLFEKLNKNKIPMPKTWVVGKHRDNSKAEAQFNYPVVIKKPDSEFSLGVFKVSNVDEYKAKVNLLFEQSDLIIVQEYLFSDFDWRIGVLNNKAIFACKYYMAKDHWQIINWDSKKDYEGDSDTFLVEDVDPKIINLAVKASSLMGDGLYGVDIKEVKGKLYLIEVNDNPSIEEGVEDLALGKELYMKIMKHIYEQIEQSRNIKKIEI